MLVGHGYSPEFVRYGVTLAGYQARVVAAAKHAVVRLRESALAVTLGLGAALSKKAAQADKQLEGVMQRLDDHVRELVEDDVEEVPAAGNGHGVTAAGSAPAPRARSRRPPPDTRMIVRKLDAIMTKLTGKLVRNPIAGYAGPADGATPFDVHGTSMNDLLDRVGG